MREDGLPTAFYLPLEASRFRATALTIGPWSAEAQHGGPPCALLAGALDRHENPGNDGHRPFVTTRLGFSLLRPVPVGDLSVRTQMTRPGRQVQRLQAQLLDAQGNIVVEADAVRILRRESAAHAPPTSAWPPIAACTPLTFPFFTVDIGYHRAVDLRVVHGSWGSTPISIWGQLRVPLVLGRATSPLEHVVTLADAQSGMGVPADPFAWSFVNPDLTVLLGREPAAGPVGFFIRSMTSGQGTGLAESELRDEHGVFGRSAQSLVVVPRPIPTPNRQKGDVDQ